MKIKEYVAIGFVIALFLGVVFIVSGNAGWGALLIFVGMIGVLATKKTLEKITEPNKAVVEVADVTDKKETKTSVLAYVAIFFILIIGGVWMFSGSDSSTKTVPTTVQETYSDSDVYYQAKTIVEKYLKAPSTAKFPWYNEATIEHLSNSGFKVTSYVDSQNGFGAMIRSNWSVVFDYSKDGVHITIYTVTIDDTLVYSNPGLNK